MKIIGINYLSESSVCLLENGKIKFAISQERINRKKNWYGIPYTSIKKLLKDTNNNLKDINYFVTCGLSSLTKDMPNKANFKLKIDLIKKSKLKNNIKKKQINFLKKREKHENFVINVRTKKIINSLKKKFPNLKVYDHHTSHAASAAYNSKFKSCYCLTIDGWGDHSSGKIFKYSNGKFDELYSTSTIDSLGYFYGSITKLLGFKPHQHEGKILGLAAYGNPKKPLKDMSKLISFDKKNMRFIGNYEKGLYQASFDNNNLTYLLKKYSKKDIAACAQFLLEKVVLTCVKSISKTKINLVLAGGVFANVKLNQKINELKNIKNIFVYPNMGDGGLSVGSAMLCYNEITKKIPKVSKDYYLGPSFSDKEVLKEIKKFKLNYSKPNNIEKIIAKKISEGKVIAHFNGKMEFGPRALGNRSILCAAKDSNINNELNKRLGRTEFMPFAPIILKNYTYKYFKLLKKLDDYKYMTLTCVCKKIMIKKSPAAVHIDNTARPQIIDKKINPRIFKILNEYKKITKIPVLINTSFNMHEEPIVCSPNDAIRGFLDGRLDYLILKNFLIKRND
tara:strand:- start:19747 stop:21438 length:1692 start_codon:yes stop_codon:yes gene_type:complete